MNLKNIIRTIPDFPVKGIQFRDITPILKDPSALIYSIDSMKNLVSNLDFDIIVGPESRGFIFGVPLAVITKKGFVPARKEGKLPAKTIKTKYNLEYGENIIEIHEDSIKKGQKILIVDDLLATGGTCKAICEIVKNAGANVIGSVFFIELLGLNGKEELKKYCDVFSLVTY
ncbi:MAG: adenine phosphoribosyltransferase [Defluviitaleaceae bacterium]|nr:adenine phosphoribosyltransferase [Defluviitaleaceae bacterium]